MAPEAEPQVTTEPVTDPSKTPQPAPTVEPTGNGEQPQAVVIDKDTKLPEDHPLVTAHTTVKGRLATATTELAEARAQAANATKLEQERDARPTAEALATLQTRYDRLEGFLQSVGGPLSKALDSRTFTKDLFETDAKVEDLVKAFLKANPTATSEALGHKSAEPAAGKIDPNELLRIAAGK